MKKGFYDKGRFKGDEVNCVRVKMMKPFIRKYGNPVLVHALNDSHSFLSILKGGEIRLPYNHNNKKISLYGKVSWGG